ncbi:hypothetical protein ABIA30_003055 [Mycobacterium sp. MAA66]
MAEVLEGADGHDPVDCFVVLFPARQQHPPGAGGIHFAEQLRHVRRLILGQRQSDDLDVIGLDRAFHRCAPTTSDIEQLHARREAQLAERQVDLCQLRFLQRHVVVFEICTAVGLTRVEEQPEEVVRQVVVRLDICEMGFEMVGHNFPFPRKCKDPRGGIGHTDA